VKDKRSVEAVGSAQRACGRNGAALEFRLPNAGSEQQRTSVSVVRHVQRIGHSDTLPTVDELLSVLAPLRTAVPSASPAG